LNAVVREPGQPTEENVKKAAMLIFLLVALPGCYAAKIDTGLPPSNTVIKQSSAACWIYGLIPPKTVETAARCNNGVSTVETQLSFVNQLVSILTLGIYTPMQIVVTCAEPSKTSMRPTETDLTVSLQASTEEIQAVFSRAADQAVRTGKPVQVYTVD